ncbi:MAG: DUF5063 domain-containing protein [Tannerella sp.]|jgi:hypothetical protein|nr:DUF5063 domain-containing protein [Tannerella sp.]
MQKDNILYSKNTLEFVTVAVEFCAFLENTAKYELIPFIDKAVRLLPLLYLKTTLLDITETSEKEEFEDAPENFIDEETYEVVRLRIADLLGEYDTFLDTFHPDIRYSDTPIVVTVSENLADMYQDIGNFAAQFRQENEEVMKKSLILCEENFRLYWGQKLLNALKALHVVRFNEIDIIN